MTLRRRRRTAVLLAAAALLGVPSSAAVGLPGGALRTPAGVAVPLAAPTPAWFTPELEARLDAAGGLLPAPVGTPLPGEVGIRPGSWMIAPAWCTMNFVFTNSVGEYAIGTAGHCAGNGARITLLTLAPGDQLPVLVRIGTVVTSRNGGIGNDFALVKIDPRYNLWVDPGIAVIGGPCGSYTGSSVQAVAHYGHGVGVGTGGTPRAGATLAWRSDYLEWAGLLAGGDSGSPIRVADLKAAGILTHGNLLVDPLVPSVIGWGTRITKALSIANGWRLANMLPAGC